MFTSNAEEVLAKAIECHNRYHFVDGLEEGVKHTSNTVSLIMSRILDESEQFEGLPASEVLRVASLVLEDNLKALMASWLEESTKTMLFK